MKQQESFNSLYWQMPGLVALKDSNSVYQACSQEVANLVFGTNNDSCILGLTDADIPGKASEFADTFLKQDNKIISSGSSLTTVDVNYWADNQLRMLLCQKRPYRNEENQIVGLTILATELSGHLMALLYQIVMLTHKKTNPKAQNKSTIFLIGGKYDDARLSAIECECLFYTLIGDTAKQIANRIKRSHRTVEQHIESLKIKFDCRTKSKLIAKMIESGFLGSIPKYFLPEPVSIDLTSTYIY